MLRGVWTDTRSGGLILRVWGPVRPVGGSTVLANWASSWASSRAKPMLVQVGHQYQTIPGGFYVTVDERSVAKALSYRANQKALRLQLEEKAKEVNRRRNVAEDRLASLEREERELELLRQSERWAPR